MDKEEREIDEEYLNTLDKASAKYEIKDKVHKAAFKYLKN